MDQPDLFKKNLHSFVRLYEFLSQITPYEDRELKQLCVYAKHLYPCRAWIASNRTTWTWVSCN